MRCHQQAGAEFLVELQHERINLISIPAIQVAGRLIREDTTRMRHQGARYGRTLPFTTRELPGLVSQPCRQPDPFQHGGRLLSGLHRWQYHVPAAAWPRSPAR